jgi:DNA-binding HxlR family transcriptional regulator
VTRTSLADFNCSLARTVDLVGDKWSLMILRDAFYGFSKFSDFKERLGVAPRVLSSRLQALVDHGILERVQERPDVDRHRYKLTESGRDLLPVIIAIVQWGDRWVFGDAGPPVKLRSKSSGKALQKIEVRDKAGDAVALQDLVFSPGPGASEETLEAFAAIARRAKS